jgi:hypothetical protein
MALPRIDTPTYELTLPLSKKKINFRPFLVKEQKNLMMAIEANDSETIERNIKQVLHNCTLSENIDIDKLPVLDVEYYFIQLRARSVGEVVENNYICTNKVDDKECNNKMSISLNLLELQVEKNPQQSDIIQLTNKISIKLKYPEFSTIEKIKQKTTSVEIAFQYYYANETTPEELMGFVEELNNDQFAKIEDFFDNLPKLNKTVQMICSKCGYDHSINVEGLESFFV